MKYIILALLSAAIPFVAFIVSPSVFLRILGVLLGIIVIVIFVLLLDDNDYEPDGWGEVIFSIIFPSAWDDAIGSLRLGNTLPAIIAICVLIVPACIGGNSIHKHRTPHPDGTYVAKTLTNKDGLPAVDSITVSDDMTFRIVRKFEDPDTGEEVFISGTGKVKEKTTRFMLRSSMNSAKYLTATPPRDKRGKAIPAKKFMDKKMYVKKKELKSDHIAIYYRNHDKNAKTKWVMQPATLNN